MSRDPNFGSYPISDRMRPRYILAVHKVIECIENPYIVDLSYSQYFSEVKGMFNRILRRDQWDWKAVHEALNYPSGIMLRGLVANIKIILKSLKEENTKDVILTLENLRNTSFLRILFYCLEHINNTIPTIIDTELPIESPNVLEMVETEINNKGNKIISEISRKKIDDANRIHQNTLQILTDLLRGNGLIVENNKLIDAYCCLKTGPAIFEVKSITFENEREQCRHALSQLYEYQFLHKMQNPSLWVVLSRPLYTDWMIDYFLRGRHIKVIWVENGILTGPSINELLASWNSPRPS